MSLNISKAMVGLARTITMDIDTTRLGPRQQAALKRMVQTGFIKGHSPSAQLAYAVRKSMDVPVITVNRWRAGWANMPTTFDAFFDALRAGAAAHSLDHNPEKLEMWQTDWQQRAIDESLRMAAQRLSWGQVHYASYYAPLFANVKLPKVEWTMPDTIRVDAFKVVEGY